MATECTPETDVSPDVNVTSATQAKTSARELWVEHNIDETDTEKDQHNTTHSPIPEETHSPEKSFCRVLRSNNFVKYLVKKRLVPPRGLLGRYLTRCLVVLVWVGVSWAILGHHMNAVSARLNTQPVKEDCLVAVDSIEGNDTHTNSSNISTDCSLATIHKFTDYLYSVAINVSLYQDILDIVQNETLNESVCAESRPSTQCQLHEIVKQICSKNTVTKVNTDLFDIQEGHFFGLITLGVVASIGGYLVGLIQLPPLTGMLLSGVILNNIPYVAVTRHINPRWSSVIRSIALVVILMRGGLAMDADSLKKLFIPVAALGSLPCILEGGVIAMIAYFFIQVSWQWSLMIGYLLAAISLAVLVPSLLQLETLKPTNADDRGLLTMMMAAGSLDVVICIALFGVFLGLAFASDTPLVLSIFRGPIEILLGIAYGVVLGMLLWILPGSDTKSGSRVRNRLFLVFGLSLFALFGAQHIKIGGTGFVGAGALAVLALTFTANLRWKKDQSSALLRKSLLMIWLFVQPFLFGLIGAAVDVYSLVPVDIGKALVVIIGGLSIRMLAVFLVTLPMKLLWKHRLVCCLSWIPKATVQAALGGIVADIASQSTNPEDACNGATVVTLVVLTIIITAPLGAALIGVLGSSLLYGLPLCPKCHSKSKTTNSTPEVQHDGCMNETNFN